MKIAITADIHLTSREKNPERFHGLENILDKLIEQNIGILIIAGDLFDASCKSPGEFEELIVKKKYAEIMIYIIPGNHDPLVSEGTFTLKNITYISKPVKLELDENLPFVFLPYKNSSSVGETLATNVFSLDSNSWYLVSHGDWLSGSPLRNDYENGLYMPLSSRDLLLYKPRKAFLGHIHIPTDSAIVHYPGSPCGLDPTESGFRSFLVFDSLSGKTSRVRVDSDFIFFNEAITIIPLNDEESYLRNLLEFKINNWDLNEENRMKARVRIVARGYSTDREKIVKVILDILKGYTLVDQNQPDVTKVNISTDTMRAQIAQSVQRDAQLLEFRQHPDEPTQDDIVLSAMSTIYGGK